MRAGRGQDPVGHRPTALPGRGGGRGHGVRHLLPAKPASQLSRRDDLGLPSVDPNGTRVCCLIGKADSPGPALGWSASAR